MANYLCETLCWRRHNIRDANVVVHQSIITVRITGNAWPNDIAKSYANH